MNDMLSEKVKKVESLIAGNDIQGILNGVYKIMGHPLLIYDMDYSYNLTAFTESIVTDDPVWNEIIRNGKFSHELLELFRDEDFIDTISSTGKIAFLVSDKLNYDRLYGKLFNRDNIAVANIIMLACEKPFERDDPICFEALCSSLSKHFYFNNFYKNYGELYQENIINLLISENITDKKLHTGHAANIDSGLKANIYIAVADISHTSNYTVSRLAYFKDLFRRLCPSFKYSVYGDYIVIILSSDYGTFNIKRDLPKLSRLFKKKNIYAGISEKFENIFDLPKYYADAVDTLNYLLKENLNRHIFIYNEFSGTHKLR